MGRPLPSAQDLGIVTPQPSLAIASYKGATGMEDDAARATYAAGAQFDRVAQHLDKAQEDFDTIQAEDRYNQYQEVLNQIALDPNEGWVNAKGENAIGPEFNAKYTRRFEAERDKILDTLESPGAKQRFSRLASVAAMRNRAKLYEHSAKERFAFDAKVASDTVQNVQQNIWRSFGDDDLFAAESARAAAVVRQFAQRQGLNEEGVTNAVQELQSQLWTRRIAAAAAAGDVRLAREYMGKATGVLTTKDKAELDAKIKPQLKVSEAQNVVGDLFDKMVSADPNAPFPAVALDAALRKHFEGDPEALRMARAEADYRRGRVEIQQRESNNDNIGKVMEAFHVKGMSMPSVMKTPEFIALQGDAKARVVLQMESVLAQRESRAQSAEGRALLRLDRQQRELQYSGMETYLRLQMDPERLQGLTPNDFMGLSSEIGWQHTQDLIRMQAGLNKPERAASARLSQQAFNGIVNDFLTPEEQTLLASSPKNDAARREKFDLQRRLAQANLQVNSIIQQRKATTLEAAQDIARQELAKTIQLKKTGLPFFGSPEETRRPLLSPRPLTDAELGRVYVPLTEADPGQVMNAALLLRELRTELAKLPLDEKFLSDTRPLLEHMLGLQKSGISRERLIRIMKREEKLGGR